MKYTVAAAAALAGVVSASPLPGPTPFELVLSSTDKSVDGQKISACHAGAGIQAACIGQNGVTFYTNFTGAAAPFPDITPPTYITYSLDTSDGPEGLKLNLVKSSGNVQEALFEPTKDGVPVTFVNQDEEAAIYTEGGDPAVAPGKDNSKLYTNWYVCETTYAAYKYNTLSWVVGETTAKPSNDTCKKVKVVRQFL